MNDVRMEVHLSAPVARVWEYLTDRDKLARWLMESDIATEVGARFAFTAAPSGTWDGRISCEVKELVEHRRLSFTWNANDINAETLVSFELEAVKDGTRLTLTHTGFEGALPGTAGRHAAGWTNALKSLRTSLCGPDPDYDWSAFKISFFIESPLSQVFAMWSTTEGLRRFWADQATCRAHDGSERSSTEMFRHGDRIDLTFPTAASTELEIINIEKDKFVTFTFGRDYGWVRVSLSIEGNRTRIDLHQFGLPTAGEAPWEVHANARGWWVFNLANLKSVLLHGCDLRVREPAAANGLGALYLPGDRTAAPPHDWTRFDAYLYVDASPDEVLARWRTAQGIESFFVGEAQFTDAAGKRRPPEMRIETGDRYDWRFIHDFQLTGRIVEATAERIAFTFGARYTVEISATEHAPGTILHLHQSGIADDPRDRVEGSLNCRCCWIYFLTTLKSQLERGIDLRDRNPETADAIAVGYR